MLLTVFVLPFKTSLARQCAHLWLKTRESLGYPLGVISDPDHLVCPKEVLEAAVKKVSLRSGLLNVFSSTPHSIVCFFLSWKLV